MSSPQMVKLAAAKMTGSVYDKAPMDLSLPVCCHPLFQQKQNDIQAALAHYEYELRTGVAGGGLGGGLIAGILTKLITTLIGVVNTPGGGGGGTPDPNGTPTIVAAVMDFINKVIVPMFTAGTWGGSVWGPLVGNLISTLLPSILSGIIGALGAIVPSPSGGTQTPVPTPLPGGFVPY